MGYYLGVTLKFLGGIMKYLLLAFLTALLISCGDDELVKGESKLVEFVKSNKVGSSNDYWLEKQSMFRAIEWDKISLIVGFTNDYDACIEFKEALSVKFPSNNYRCSPAN